MQPFHSRTSLKLPDDAELPALQAQYGATISAQDRTPEGTLTMNGLVQLALLSHHVFQALREEQVRDIRKKIPKVSLTIPARYCHSCRDRPLLLQGIARALVWYDTQLRGMGRALDRMHAETWDGWQALARAILVYQARRRGPSGPKPLRVDVLRKAYQTLGVVVQSLTPADYLAYAMKDHAWDRTRSKAATDCYRDIVEAFRRHGPARYPLDAISHATAAIVSTLIPTHRITAAGVKKALERSVRDPSSLAFHTPSTSSDIKT